MRLLIADDDPNTIILLQKYLNLWNCEVVTAVNGTEALDMINGNNPPQIVILDWLMPDINGVEVIKKTRAQESDNPPYIILFTVRDEKEAIIEGLQAGANDYITKSFDKDEFHARIQVANGLSNCKIPLRKESGNCGKLSRKARFLQGLCRFIPIAIKSAMTKKVGRGWKNTLLNILVSNSATAFAPTA